MIARHLFARGRVQGVRFRASMVEQAQRAGVAGWVRNRRDGSVEAVIQGAPDDVDRITEWARHGPARARVTRLDVHDIPPGTRSGFQQRETT